MVMIKRIINYLLKRESFGRWIENKAWCFTAMAGTLEIQDLQGFFLELKTKCDQILSAPDSKSTQIIRVEWKATILTKECDLTTHDEVTFHLNCQTGTCFTDSQKPFGVMAVHVQDSSPRICFTCGWFTVILIHGSTEEQAAFPASGSWHPSHQESINADVFHDTMDMTCSFDTDDIMVYLSTLVSPVDQ